MPEAGFGKVGATVEDGTEKETEFRMQSTAIKEFTVYGLAGNIESPGDLGGAVAILPHGTEDDGERVIIDTAKEKFKEIDDLPVSKRDVGVGYEFFVVGVVGFVRDICDFLGKLDGLKRNMMPLGRTLPVWFGVGVGDIPAARIKVYAGFAGGQFAA